MTCTNCGKPLRRDNKRGYCNSVERGCVAASQQVYNETHREEHKLASRTAYQVGNKPLVISQRFQSRYGITEADKLQLWVSQGGLCAYGGEPLPYEKSHLDHWAAHHPGYKRKGCPGCIRGVVCNGHNQRNIAVQDEEGWLPHRVW